MDFNFDYIISHLEDKASMGLPIICFCITGNNIHITTKKIASRYFEYLDESTRYIEFKIYNNIIPNDLEIENRLKFYDYYFQFFENNSDLTVDEFFNKLGINSITDIFSARFLDNWDITLVTRNPIIRLLSGFTEIVDSIIGNEISKENTEILKINLSEIEFKSFSGIKNLSTPSLSLILNHFSKKLDYQISFDEHTSAWNTFLNFIILKSDGCLEVIDIDDINDMKRYPNTNSEISNKPTYIKWIEGGNRTNILNFIKNLDYYLVSEYSNYLRIKTLKSPF